MLRSRLAALALAALLVADGAAAQYFGRNKVRYDDFDFEILETEHFDLYYYEEEEQAARDVARMAERWYDRLSTILQHEFDERKTIVLYADDADFRQTNVVSGLIGEGTQGVTEGLRQRVVLFVGSTYEDTNHVLGHELVHQFQYDIAQRGGSFQNFVRLPLFIIEGMAEYFSVGRRDALTAMWMRDAVLRDDSPTISELQRDPRYNEYQYGQPLWAYIGGVYGDEAAVTLFKRALETPIDSAIVSVTGLQPDSLSARWEQALRDQYLPLVAGRTLPVSTGEALAELRADGERAARAPADSLALLPLPARRVLARAQGSGDINIAPQVSPDGRYLAFLSERDLFGIDLYLADAQTGRVLKKLEEVGSDPHTDAIRFIESAGTWRPDGDQFAYVVFAGGDNEIAILDVERRDVIRRIAVRGVGAIKDPAWSPDGRQIAFAGVKGGITDLYVVDVEGGTVRQLTNDRYADLQPAWSPDGQTLAFVTDRGPGTDLDRLTFAPVRLAIYSLDSGEIEVLSLFADAKHINPAWSPDGRSLYFISDRDGFNDVYRLDRPTGGLFRVTRLATGVAGIADLSPALSVSSQTGLLAFSAFEGQDYSVYALAPSEAQGEPVQPVPEDADQAELLPPADAAPRSPVEGYLGDALEGLPETRAFPSRSYRPGLRLDYVSQPSVGAVYDPYYGSGFGVAGGIQLLFSDQLSDQVLGVSLAANGTLQDIGGQALYLNRARRFNYGAIVGHVPYLQVFYGADPNTGIGTRYYYRQFVSQAAALAAYPLNQTQRFEAEAGYRRIGYDLEYDRITCDASVGGCFFDGREEVDDAGLPDALNLFETGVAFVGDYSFFGFTSPIRGGRYRLGVDGTFGSLTYATATADYRQYLFLRPPGFPQRLPVTLALRGLHYGRYGLDSDTSTFNPLYLGYGALVRGYTSNTFERTPEGDAAYLAFYPRLYGSRLAVANAELRLPLLGVPQLGLLSFPYLPTELVLFADAGLAWGETQRLFLFDESGQRIGQPLDPDNIIVSAGVGARINVLGALVIEPYYAFPLSREAGGRGGVFGLNFTPGW